MNKKKKFIFPAIEIIADIDDVISFSTDAYDFGDVTGDDGEIIYD